MSLNRWLLLAGLVLLATFGLSHAERIRYDNYRLYKATPENEDQLAMLRDLKVSSDSIIFLNSAHVVGADVHMVVAPHKIPDLLEILGKAKIKYELQSKDFQKSMDDIEGEVRPRSNASSEYNWFDYNDLEDTYAWMRSLAKQNPNIVTLIEAGKTYEGRSMLGLKIFKSGREKPGIFIEAGIHAREWIAPAAATYIINQLLTSNVPSIKQLGDNYNWYIVPHVNADGYVYSRKSDRIWRKTRKPYGVCFGADPNRNWDFYWNKWDLNNQPCNDEYAGPNAFSEIETLSLSNYIASIKDKIQLYLSFHSFSQVLIYPNGYTASPPDNIKDYQQVAKAALSAISKRYNTKYEAKSIYNFASLVSGSTLDWVYGTQGVRMTFCYELRPAAAHDSSGFLLPPSQILPTSEELLDSITAMVDQVQKLGYFN
ncbi:PREDICTED: zinc carboxypeptidase A 1-like [Drosophila arizonae]|uniref:Zinc carboxypeptidase A 1-like n=1 Tax=Drosophila arizonae TaxID=7263 RepID=A0ABM1PRS5_DROAR|nr:PREDICTED: zinc carboxypeptidase A 1-like [Drosophila arizonae]